MSYSDTPAGDDDPSTDSATDADTDTDTDTDATADPAHDFEADPSPGPDPKLTRDFDQYPDSVEPVRFYVRDAGEIIACGCSFPFPHDELVVSQTTMTATAGSFRETLELTGGDTIEFLDSDLPDAADRPWLSATDPLVTDFTDPRD